MVAPVKRRMKKKFRRVTSGTKKEYIESKHKKVRCALDGTVLSGVPHATKTGTRAHAKSEKRPSAPFGGVLGGRARAEVFVELGKVVAGIKPMDDVDVRYRTYVKQALKRTEVKKA